MLDAKADLEIAGTRLVIDIYESEPVSRVSGSHWFAGFLWVLSSNLIVSLGSFWLVN